jgi:pilus assembly protein Flp/PilA
MGSTTSFRRLYAGPDSRSQDGAALLEYTVLLGILLVAVTGTITLVGGGINGSWTSLHGALPANK